MAWFKVDDKLWGHPKWMGLPAGARALWVTAGSYCASNETDGIVPVSALPALGARRRDAEALVEAGLWDAVERTPKRRSAKTAPDSRQISAKSQPADDLASTSARSRTGRTSPTVHAYRFHDWDDYQPTRAQVRAEREAARERMRAVREARKARPVRPNTDRTSAEVREPRPDPTRPSSLTLRGHVASLLGWPEEEKRLDHVETLLATHDVRSPRAWLTHCHETGDLEHLLTQAARPRTDDGWSHLPRITDADLTPPPGGDPA